MKKFLCDICYSNSKEIEATCRGLRVIIQAYREKGQQYLTQFTIDIDLCEEHLKEVVQRLESELRAKAGEVVGSERIKPLTHRTWLTKRQG